MQAAFDGERRAHKGEIRELGRDVEAIGGEIETMRSHLVGEDRIGERVDAHPAKPCHGFEPGETLLIDEEADFIFAGCSIAASEDLELNAGPDDRFLIVGQRGIKDALLRIASDGAHKAEL